MSITEIAPAALVERVPPRVPPRVMPRVPLTREQSARFLSQAAFGGDAQAVAEVQALGPHAWLETQFAAPPSASYVQSISSGPDIDTDTGRTGLIAAIWRRLVSNPDVLRQRVTLALSEIFVVNVVSIGGNQRGYSAAAFMDVLESNAFGNYRDLLTHVSRTTAMGSYLTFVGNRKANPVTGSQPDENYARELMQLFTIGLVKLNIDGTPQLDGNNRPIDSYTQDDVMGLARVFTGWARTNTGGDTAMALTPMRQIPAQHEWGEKRFLGVTVPANTDGFKSLDMAVDALMRHPNMAPFVARQLIQRLVCSHPSPAYVARVAQAFRGATPAQNGDMKNTIRAVLLDNDARSAAGLTNPQYGKLREPMVRFVQWARTFKLAAPAGKSYDFRDLSSDANALAQSPLRSPSVFNFFRPGFVPPAGELGRLGITAPEFQITTETSVAGYLNFMQDKIQNGYSGVKADYSALEPLAADAKKLLDEVNLLLAAGQLSAATLATLKSALDTINPNTTAGRNSRIYAALLLVMAAPEYLVQK